MSDKRITEILENSHDTGSGGIDVNVQSQTSPLFKYLVCQEQKTDITLTAQADIDDDVINVTAGHGFTAADGEVMVLRYGDQFSQLRVISVATNAITVEMPIDAVYPIVGTTVMRANVNMNVDGSVEPVDFKYTNYALSGATTPVDITKIIVTMQHGANVPDDAKFGGITALTLGMYIRKVDEIIFNYGNYTKNSDFRAVGGVITYSDKAPAGTNGTNIVFDIENIFGQVIRLDPKSNDELVAMVRDDISASEGMAGMTISIVGALTRGE